MPHSGLQIVELRHVPVSDMEPLLGEATSEWRDELDWDFSQNAEQIRHFMGRGELPGIALVDCGHVAGYAYIVLEEPRGIIGDVYLRPGWRNVDSVMRLFRLMLDVLSVAPGITRVESQLMLVQPHEARVVQGERFVRLFERRLLSLELSEARELPSPQVNRRFRFAPLDSSDRDSLSRLIVRSYEGHIDGQINDQFTSQDRAADFMGSLLDHAGCGDFFRPGSFFAFDRETQQLVGVVLSSFVARDTGHIMQLCVAPEAQNAGLGRQLLRLAACAMAEGGARRVTLTVTAANLPAVRLYEKYGFRDQRRFCAFVWDAHARMSNSI